MLSACDTVPECQERKNWGTRKRTTTKNAEKTEGDEKSGAESGALSSDCAALGGNEKANIDPRLARLIHLYDTLDEARQNKLLALAETLAKLRGM